MQNVHTPSIQRDTGLKNCARYNVVAASFVISVPELVKNSLFHTCYGTHVKIGFS
jgi:hypothetical protein